MIYLEEVQRTKAMIAEFQSETKSNSVLDLCVWLENRIALMETHRKDSLRKVIKK